MGKKAIFLALIMVPFFLFWGGQEAMGKAVCPVKLKPPRVSVKVGSSATATLTTVADCHLGQPIVFISANIVSVQLQPLSTGWAIIVTGISPGSTVIQLNGTLVDPLGNFIPYTKDLIVTVRETPLGAGAEVGQGKGEDSSSSSKTKVEVELMPDDPELDAEGEARYVTQTSSKGTVKKEFRAEVKVPIDPNSPLGITDVAAAEGAEILLTLSRGNTDYAECHLDLEEVKMGSEDDSNDNGDNEGEGEAEYKVDVLLKNTTLQLKEGACDIDLGTDGVQTGVPDVQAGDVATVWAVTDADDTPFLQGTFEQD